jgi:3-oxo-5alpha-steroid 4-dehydrogenase
MSSPLSSPASSESTKATPTQPRKLKDVKHWDFETDVAIVGFGGAGASAAIEAADAGADVTLFEVSSASGGSTAMSSAEIYMGGSGGTPPQRASGFEDSTEDMFKYLMATQGELADEAKIRLYCDNSLEHYNWLTQKIGIPYKMSFHKERAIMCLTDDCLLYTGNEKAWPFNEIAKPCPRGHNIQVEGDNGGPLLMKNLTAQVNQRNVKVHFETRVLTLVVDENNEVQGLVVRINREEKTVRARKGVLLCAGGFVMNKEMLKKYAPKLLRCNAEIGNPGDTGTGILMGMGVGAAAINMNEGFVSLPFYPPASATHGLLVNSQAQRFINEDSYHGRVGYYLLQQLGDRVYFIFNAENFERPIFLNADIAGTGETVEELAGEIGLDADMLKHTIEHYNKCCDKGEDPLFHKGKEYLKRIDPPYAALDVTPGRGAFFPFFTLGGLDTLPTGEVLTPERNIIKGLYAAGRTACGLPRTGAGYGSGMSVGDATFFGRQAGKAIAAAPSR